MTDAGLLPLRRQLTVEEAAQLLAAGSGHDSGELSALLIEAVESGALPARIERWEVIDYFDGNYLGAINPMATTVERTDLDDWCQRMQIASPSTAGDKAAAAATAPAVPAKSIHKAVGRRGDALNAVIKMAKAEAADASDYHSVWAALVQIAERPDRKAPLVGYAEGQIKYSTETKDGIDVAFFSKDALRKRMDPSAR